MRKRNVIISLDVGTSTIKAALAEVNYNQDVNILGVARVPSYGLRKGNIIDIEKTAKSIDNCLSELERLTGVEIFSALVGFSGISVSAVNNHAVVAVGNPNYEINQEDKERVIQSARNIALPPDRTIVQTIERQYIVDGYEGVRDPVGMVGSRLEVEVAIIIAATAAIQNLQRSTQRINLRIDKIVYNPLLAAESVLLPTEKEMGVALVDIGGGTIEITYFEAGSIISTSVLPLGGEYITKDLAIVLKTSIEEAAKIKETEGVASMDMVEDGRIINVRNVQGKDVKQVSQQVIADIISARIIEMLEMIYVELKNFGCLGKLPGGIVLIGGEARLPGIVNVMEDYLNLPVRLGMPENLRGITTDFNCPQNAVVLGGLVYAARDFSLNYERKDGASNVWGKIKYWFKDLFS
ncbi:MAG: cell division protein FtsA [Syntrophomonadaceae bacterium]|nr:cell division protein FtsA [Syntrophomonadaceae bacterium]